MSKPGETIRVLFYSGYRGEETPRALVYEGREYPIGEILDRKRFFDKATGLVSELFICKVGGKTVEIRRDESGLCEITPPADVIFPPQK